MPRLKKSKTASKVTLKKTRGKVRTITSNALRDIQKIELSITRDQAKLEKCYEKAIKVTDKKISTLSAQIEKLRKKPKAGSKIRGRKPAKNTIQLIQDQLQVLKDEKSSLTEGYKKFLAKQKSALLSEKEWKKKNATSVKKTRKPKKAKTASAETDAVDNIDATESSEQEAWESTLEEA